MAARCIRGKAAYQLFEVSDNRCSSSSGRRLPSAQCLHDPR